MKLDDIALLGLHPRVRLDGIQSELKKPAQYKVSIVHFMCSIQIHLWNAENGNKYASVLVRAW